MRKKLFDIEFDPTQAPGYAGRHNSLDSVVGAKMSDIPEEKKPDIFQTQNLRAKFKSGQVPQLMPSVILRKKGRAP